jgi:diguanylate cyclase (GGDEF)-like protein/PAS domain S-box-containing protein
MNENIETDSAVYKTLLESTKAIPWKIDWNTLRFTYIGPQIEKVLGWTQASWVSAQDWADRIHEEDRERVFNYCVSQSKAGVDHEADYRALTKDGNYVWIRDVVHVVRRPDGEVDSLVGFMFDITERKDTEDRLLRLQKELEELSFKDGLTGIANRRMFDTVMDKEWRNALRQCRPLSLILLDVDDFKQYNDHYGHLQGDECLRRLARALAHAPMRPRDFFGRFGGEEFVLVLPETDAQAARVVAQRCQAMLAKEGIVHAKSRVHSFLTISLGIHTLIPTPDDNPADLIRSVDARLYQAKRAGRNCIVDYDA